MKLENLLCKNCDWVTRRCTGKNKKRWISFWILPVKDNISQPNTQPRMYFRSCSLKDSSRQITILLTYLFQKDCRWYIFICKNLCKTDSFICHYLFDISHFTTSPKLKNIFWLSGIPGYARCNFDSKISRRLDSMPWT